MPLLSLATDLFYWSIWGAILALAGLLILYLQGRSTSTPFQVARETFIIAAAFFCYFLVRGFVTGRESEAIERARDLIDFEQALHIFWEPDWQSKILQFDLLVDLSNWMYIYGHWPVILFTAVWLFFFHREGYGLYRTAFLISGAIGLIIFTFFPVAPPRLVEGFGFVDTVADRSEAYRVLQPPAFVNQYAAMPSLHFGWNLLVGIAIVYYLKPLPVRLFGAIMPAAMFASMVFTANHFILDGVAGGSLALAGLAAAALLRHLWRARRGDPYPRDKP